MTFHTAETLEEVLKNALSSTTPFGDSIGEAVTPPTMEVTLN
jgi:hypothetical protein